MPPENYGFERLEACLSTGTFRNAQAARDYFTRCPAFYRSYRSSRRFHAGHCHDRLASQFLILLEISDSFALKIQKILAKIKLILDNFLSYFPDYPQRLSEKIESVTTLCFDRKYRAFVFLIQFPRIHQSRKYGETYANTLETKNQLLSCCYLYVYSEYLWKYNLRCKANLSINLRY